MDGDKITSPLPHPPASSMPHFTLTMQPTYRDKVSPSQRRCWAFLTTPELGERFEPGEPRPVLEVDFRCGVSQIPGGWKALLTGILGMPLPPSENSMMSLP